MGGRVFNGSTFCETDIGITSGKIKEIDKISAQSETEINAAGCIVSPGFIDVHTHCDLAVTDLIGEKRSSAEDSAKSNLCYLRQGVTSVVTGNCGLGTTDTAKWFLWVRYVKAQALWK